MQQITDMSESNASVESIDLLWDSVGKEVIIFTFTLVFALIVTKLTGPPAQQKKRLKTAKHATDDSYKPGPARPAKAVRAVSEPDAKPEATVVGEKVKATFIVRDVSALVDEIITLSRHAPQGASSPVQALARHRELRSLLRSQGVVLGELLPRSKQLSELYTSLVHCAVRSKQCRVIPSLIDEMVEQAVPRTLSFYESTMKQLAGQKEYRIALATYESLAADGIDPSAVTYSCLIGFAMEIGELAQAVMFFEKLAEKSTPSIRAYMTVLRVHGQRQDWSASVSIIRDMQRRGVPVDCLVLNVVLGTAVTVDKIDEAESLIREFEEAAKSICDVVSYNTLLKGYAMRDDAAKAVAVIGRMNRRKLVPNSITFNTAMDASVRSFDVNGAWSLLHAMRESGLRPDKFTCSILVKGLSKENPTTERLRACLELLQDGAGVCDASLRASLFNPVLEAATNVGDTVLLMKVFACMRQYKVPVTDAAQKKLRELAESSS